MRPDDSRNLQLLIVIFTSADHTTTVTAANTVPHTNTVPHLATRRQV